LDLVLISDNEVLIQFGSRTHPSELIRDRNMTGVLGRTVSSLLRGSATISQLLSDIPVEHQPEASNLIADLTDRGIFTDVRKSPVDQYLAYTFTGESNLAERSVSLIGNGPIGARMACGFAQHGIRLRLLDDRKVNPIWRKFLPLTLASPALDEVPVHQDLYNRLHAAGNSTVEFIDAKLDVAGLEEAVRVSDFVVLALEQPDIRLAHLVNRACIRERKPWLLATIDGNFGLTGPLFVPLHTACYNDYRTLADAAVPSSESMARRYKEHILARGAASFFPGLPAYADIVAGHSCLAVLEFLLRNTSFAMGRVLSIDFERMFIDVEDVYRFPRCPVCSGERSAYQPAFSAEILSRPQMPT
jgi:bacteriocin biosynthesis cyclodehydratase domain-containing protein